MFRINGQTLKRSTLDHVYSNSSEIVDAVQELSVSASNHCQVLVTVQCGGTKTRRKQLIRDWSKYTKEHLLELLSRQDWDIRCLKVQDYSNQIERNIMWVLHDLIPFKTRVIRNDSYSDPKSAMWMKKRRENMYTNAKRRNSARLMEECKRLDKKILCQIITSNRQVIRTKILQGGACKRFMGGLQDCNGLPNQSNPP